MRGCDIVLLAVSALLVLLIVVFLFADLRPGRVRAQHMGVVEGAIEMSPRLSDDDLTDLAAGQRRMSEMLRHFDDTCSRHGITYWVQGGTLLGAMLYKGWIPWDGDVDLGMPREDYERFCGIVAYEGLPDGMWLQNRNTDPHYRSNIAKIRDLNSCYKDYKPTTWHNGLQVDIFVHDARGDDGLRNTGGGDHPNLKVSDVLPTRRVPFDGFTVPVPRLAEDYLTEQYPKWRELPPVEKRFPHEGRMRVDATCEFHHERYPQLYRGNMRATSTYKKTREENIRNTLIFLIRTLNKYDVGFLVVYGTLLGYERIGDVIPFDDDADIMVTRSDMDRILDMREVFKAGGLKLLRAKGSAIVQLVPVNSSSSIGKHKNGMVDIYMMEEKNGLIYDRWNKWVYRKELIYPLKSAVFLGEKIKIPAQHKTFLEYHYGLDYMTPRQRFKRFPDIIVAKEPGGRYTEVWPHRADVQLWKRNKRVAVVFWGLTRSLTHTFDNIKASVLDQVRAAGLTPDVYMHTYRVSGTYENARAGEHAMTLNPEDHAPLSAIARGFAVDDQNEIDKILHLERYRTSGNPWPGKGGWGTLNNFVRALYSRKQAYGLIKNADDYEYVVFCRPDLKFRAPVEMPRAMGANAAIVPAFHSWGGLNDRFCIAGLRAAGVYGTLYDGLLAYSQGAKPHSETFLASEIKGAGIHVEKDDEIIFARVRADGSVARRDGRMI